MSNRPFFALISVDREGPWKFSDPTTFKHSSTSATACHLFDGGFRRESDAHRECYLELLLVSDNFHQSWSVYQTWQAFTPRAGWRWLKGKFTCNLQLEICDSTKAGSVIYLRPLAKFGETLQGFLELGVSENWEKRYTTIYGNVLQFLNISFQYLLMINDKLHLGVLDPVLEVNLGHEKMTSQR